VALSGHGALVTAGNEAARSAVLPKWEVLCHESLRDWPRDCVFCHDSQRVQDAGPGGTTMKGVLDESGSHMVGVDHSTLKREGSGPDFNYSVTLVGRVDAVWVEAYRILQADSTAFRHLRLDPISRTVTFLCRGVDGPTQVFDVLERLDALIKRVNRQISGKLG
jgi:hypothetical protein